MNSFYALFFRSSYLFKSDKIKSFIFLSFLFSALLLSFSVQIQSLGVVWWVSRYINQEAAILKLPWGQWDWWGGHALVAFIILTAIHAVATLSYYGLREWIVARAVQKRWLTYLDKEVESSRLASISDQEVIAVGARAWITNRFYMPMRIGIYIAFSSAISIPFTCVLACGIIGSLLPVRLMRRRFSRLHQKTIHAQEEVATQLRSWHQAKNDLAVYGLAPWQKNKIFTHVHQVIKAQMLEGMGINFMRAVSFVSFYLLIGAIAYLARTILKLQFEEIIFLLLSLARLRDTLANYADNSNKINEGIVRLSQWKREDGSEAGEKYQMVSSLDSGSAVEMQDLTLRFSSKKIICEDISLNLYFGEVYFLVGNSGSGKTSLIYLFAQKLRPTRGSVSFYSPPMICPAEPLVYLGATLEENLFIDTQEKENCLQFLEEIQAISILNRMLERFGGWNQPITQHSLGEGRMITLLRAFIRATHQEILIFDEPLAHLDYSVQNDVKQIIFHLHSSHRLLLITMHHLSQWSISDDSTTAEKKLSERLVLLQLAEELVSTLS